MSFKRALAPLALAFAVAAAPMAAQAHNTPDLADTVETIMPSVAHIAAGKESPDPAKPNEHGQGFGSGSGFVYDGTKGYIITNNHVVDDADQLFVAVNDMEFEATLVGTDPLSDIAVLQVVMKPGQTLPTATLSDSDAVRVGNSVIAIGAPFGFTGTVTTGIISAKQRVLGAGPYDQFLQTDASINPGNSGGPLFNMNGEVIGVNTAIISPSRSSAGIGFSIPSNHVKWVADTIIKHGKVDWGFLGAAIADIDPAMVKSMNLPDNKGVLIRGVSPGGPAEKGGLKENDILLSVDGNPVNSPQEMILAVGKVLSGNTGDFTIRRDGVEIALAITVGSRPEKPKDTQAPALSPDEREEQKKALPAPAP
jgi:S1-C subfamily serine protease